MDKTATYDSPSNQNSVRIIDNYDKEVVGEAEATERMKKFHSSYFGEFAQKNTTESA